MYGTTSVHDGGGDQPANLLDVIARHAERDPDAIALLEPGREPVTYAQLHARVESGIQDLRAAGIERRDRVAVAASNDIPSAVLLISTICAAVCCPLNPALAQAEFEALFDVLEPAAVVMADDAAAAKLLRAVESRSVPVLGRPGGDGAAPTGVLAADRKALALAAEESLLLRTSGTTSAGKLVPLSAATMLATAYATIRAYELTGADRRLNFNPLFHMQGLIGSLITVLVSGSSIVCAHGFEPGNALGMIEEFEPTWFSASPMMHRMVLDHAQGVRPRAPRLRFVRVGAAALPAVLREELEALYQVPVVESYGMTEAGQICSTPVTFDDPVRGLKPQGSQVGILGEDGTIGSEPGVHGEIVVRGANVIERYLWPPEADSAFVGEWLRTGDLGRLEHDGSLTITGRIKEVINRHGEKISPYEVEDVLLRHPSVAQAVVFGFAEDELTDRVGAAVVPRPGCTIDEQELCAFAVDRLAPFKVPERVIVCEELPISASGKLVRADFAALIAAAEPQAAEPDPDTGVDGRPRTRPRTAVQAALAGLWAYALNRPAVGVDEDFFALGGDSLSAVFLLLAVHETLGANLSAVDLFDRLNTIERMADAIDGKSHAS